MRLLALQAVARMSECLSSKENWPLDWRDLWSEARWNWPRSHADQFNWHWTFDWTLSNQPYFKQDTYAEMVSG